MNFILVTEDDATTRTGTRNVWVADVSVVGIAETRRGASLLLTTGDVLPVCEKPDEVLYRLLTAQGVPE